MSLHDMVTRWWRGDLGAAGDALDVVTAPAELLYRGATGVRNALYDTGALASTSLPVPVVSIGNLAVGGTGKTPVTAWLARTLADGGRSPAVLHGGYADDEPALHREMNPHVPVFVGRDRVATGRAAIAGGADIILLDDAFQHRRLRRDLDIVLIAAETWIGRRPTLPRGPWREAASALARAQWIVVTRRTASLDEARAALQDAVTTGMGMGMGAIVHIAATEWQHAAGVSTGRAPGEPAFAVAGIATPDALLANARGAGALIHQSMLYPDHHAYTTSDARVILEQAGDGPIVTTAKDWVKLRTLLPAERVWVLAQRVVPEDGADALVTSVMGLGK